MLEETGVVTWRFMGSYKSGYRQGNYSYNQYITGTKVSTYGGLSKSTMNMYRGEAERPEVRFTWPAWRSS